MEWLMGLWYARLRRIDLEIFWPVCKEKARDLDHARAAFAIHALDDRAWLFLGEEEVHRQITELK
jgi:hypothetical protein